MPVRLDKGGFEFAKGIIREGQHKHHDIELAAGHLHGIMEEIKQ
jgi:hypothetical protein